jgi:hypothetical protein
VIVSITITSRPYQGSLLEFLAGTARLHLRRKDVTNEGVLVHTKRQRGPFGKSRNAQIGVTIRLRDDHHVGDAQRSRDTHEILQPVSFPLLRH